MTFDVRKLTEVSTSAEFYTISEQSPGMVKGRAAWEAHCNCGQPECFAHMFAGIYNGPYVEPEDVEVLISRWEAMTIILFDTFDAIIKNWIEEYRPIREYRCALAMKEAMENGPGEIFVVDGAELYVSPDNPPPLDLQEAMRETLTVN